jgi:hypothetical protein
MGGPLVTCDLFPGYGVTGALTVSGTLCPVISEQMNCRPFFFFFPFFLLPTLRTAWSTVARIVTDAGPVSVGLGRDAV